MTKAHIAGVQPMEVALEAGETYHCGVAYAGINNTGAH